MLAVTGCACRGRSGYIKVIASDATGSVPSVENGADRCKNHQMLPIALPADPASL